MPASLSFPRPVAADSNRLWPVLALALSVCIGVVLTPQLVTPVLAVCAPDGVPGVDVNCTGTDTDGYEVPATGVLAIVVDSGALVTDTTGGPAPGIAVIDGSNGPVSSFLNNGSVVATINDHDGVFLPVVTTGDVVNNGTITGTGIGNGLTIGILQAGRLINRGTITGDGGFLSFNDIAAIENSGSFVGTDDDAITVLGTITSLVNNGLLMGDDDGVDAFDIGTLINSGTIIGVDDGVDADNGGGTGRLVLLINSGTIRGGDDNDFSDNGVAALHIVELINSGLIQGGGTPTTGYAIEQRGIGNTQLTLNAGSVIVGFIDLGNGANTLNIGQGLSLNSLFDGFFGPGDLPALGSVDGHLVAFTDATVPIDTRQIVAVDLSAFASFDDALDLLTRSIGQSLLRRPSPGTAPANQQLPAAFWPSRPARSLPFDAALVQPMEPRSHVWIDSYGSMRLANSDRVGGDFAHLLGGLIGGFDGRVGDATTIGAHAGFGAATATNDTDTQTVDYRSYFAGIQAQGAHGTVSWDASLTAGYNDYDANRQAANNLVVGGLETANASFGGWFVTPQLSVTRLADNPWRDVAWGDLLGSPQLEKALTLRYSGLFLDGYTETGTTNPLTASAHQIHLASTRASVAVPFTGHWADGASAEVKFIGGMEGSARLSDDTISGTLLGQRVTTSLQDDRIVGRVFTGMSAEYARQDLSIVGRAETSIDTTGSFDLSASLGIRIAF